MFDPVMTDEQLAQWAHSHETDIKIAKAIMFISRNEPEMQRVWQATRGGGSEAEFVSILEIVTNNTPVTDEHREMCWGCMTLGEILDEMA